MTQLAVNHEHIYDRTPSLFFSLTRSTSRSVRQIHILSEELSKQIIAGFNTPLGFFWTGLNCCIINLTSFFHLLFFISFVRISKTTIAPVRFRNGNKRQNLYEQNKKCRVAIISNLIISLRVENAPTKLKHIASWIAHYYRLWTYSGMAMAQSAVIKNIHSWIDERINCDKWTEVYAIYSQLATEVGSKRYHICASL